MQNNLGQEISTYLLQHKDNPIHWQAWSDETLALAKTQNKPIFLSIGYSSCHWCHVMARESFSDQETADILNAHFINIKVDREERPDIDLIYMHAANLMGEAGGWPLNAFLTPDGDPFFCGTYFPPVPRYGRVSFNELLKEIIRVWNNNQKEIDKTTHEIRDALTRSNDYEQAERALTLSDLDQTARRIMKLCDIHHGGLRDDIKFPQAFLWEFLWHIGHLHKNTTMKNTVITTANNICLGGIYDHLEGGFFRYATDQHWRIPHFEKMLFDNAQLIQWLTLLYKSNPNHYYKQCIESTISWLENNLLQPHGGFACSLDAETEENEGTFYIWDEADIDAILNNDSALFKKTFHMIKGGNWRGKNILYRDPNETWDLAHEKKISTLCAQVCAVRNTRQRPACDDKILADWNGLTILALTKAAMVFQKKKWLTLAQNAYRFINDHMIQDQQLFHTYRTTQTKQAGLLEDYANLAHAALALYQATGDASYLKQACHCADQAIAYFWDQEGDGFFQNNNVDIIITRTKSALDNATPSGNGVMAFVLVTLHHLTGEERYLEYARKTIHTFSDDIITERGLAYNTLMVAKIMLSQAICVTLAGAQPEALKKVLAQHPNPRILIKYSDDTTTTPTATLCTGRICTGPIEDPNALLEELSKH